MKQLHTDSGAPFFLGEDLFNEMIAFCEKLGSKTVVICEEGVEKIGKKLGLDLLTFPGGEVSKTREMKALLEDELLTRNVGRDTVIVALGGGVTLDLVGFLASTYLRGVPLVLAPTTLLAIVDASLGNKTGVNTPQGKNLIGSFYSPKAIFADLNTLQTLPKKEWLNGLAEIWKAGLIADPALLKEEVHTAIEKAIRVKIKILAKDPTEQGMRRILNFGHTIGHAIEKVAEYTIAHGEAVALGTVVESYLSYKLGHLSKKEFGIIQKHYETAGFSLELPPNYRRKDLLAAMNLDKKKAGKDVRFVLIDKIGHAMPFDGAYCTAISSAAKKDMLDWMEAQYG